MADANIFQQYLKPVKSVLDYQNEYDQADANKNALQQSAMALQKGQMDMQNAQAVMGQRNALRDAVQSGQIDLSNPMHVTKAMALYPDAAPALIKVTQDQAKSTADVNHTNAQTGEVKSNTSKADYEITDKKRQKAITDIASFTDSQQALASLEQHIMAGDIDPQQGQLIKTTIPQNPADFPKWQIGMLQKIMSAKDGAGQIAPDANTVANNNVSLQNNASNNATSRANNRDNNERMTSNAVSVTHGVQGLSDAQNEALFGVNGAVTTGRLDPNRLNSRTASMLADAYIKNPSMDMSKTSADISLSRNAGFRQKAMTAEVLPEIMQNMVDSGKKIGFSDNRTLGKMQGWVKGEFNDPAMTEYMVQRNDALMTIAGVMRGNGMTDMAHKAETEVSSPTMSPAALDAWMQGQMKSLQPRLNNNRKITRDAPPTSAPSNKVVNFGDLK